MILGRNPPDYLHGQDQARSTREIAVWVMAHKGVEIASAKQLQHFINRVWRVLTVLKERGLVTCEVESRRVLRLALIE